MEAKQDKSEEFFRQVIENARQLMWEVDKKGVYTFVSPIVKELLGCKPEEIVEKKCFYDLFHPQEQQKLKEEITACFDKKQSFRGFIGRYMHKDGKEVWLSSSAVPLFDKEGNLLGYRGISIDVTESKKAERVLIETKDELWTQTWGLKKANEAIRFLYKELKDTQGQIIQIEKFKAVAQLASGIAHEVKNPLGIVLQDINYLEKKLPSDKDISQILEMMKTNIKRADDIVCTLIDFSRVSKIDLGLEDINSVLETSLVLVQHKCKLEKIEVIKEMAVGLPKVLVDKRKMEQVFVNIFLNAFQAMPNGGKLFLRTYIKQLNELREGIGLRANDIFKLQETAVIVEIEDTGIGISAENLKKVFDPFFTTKGPRNGTGLGLSVTKNIINLHNGLIDIESQEGKGTKVIIILKIAGGK
jgi:PAS domain S-box-containing protein